MKFVKPSCLVFLLLSVSPALAEVWLHTKSYSTVPTGRVAEHKELMGLQIELGFTDKRSELIPISNDEATTKLIEFTENRNGQLFLKISNETYILASTDMRARMQSRLLSFMGEVRAYYPWVDLQQSNKTVPVEQLLSSFARRWANQDSGQNGPNCFYSAIASINDGWMEPRFMSESEFLCHLERSFTEVDSLEQFGDILLLYSANGTPEHAAVYVGRSHMNDKILMTKNGHARGFYLFMDLETITRNKFMFSDTAAKFYRLARPSITSECGAW